ncbi:UTP--glucose-1-phosphate uridylyltransferase [Chloroflexia bacterium SDU3-3]|nr:UTP--glucose-1-phosphate uridylyltransferase [Chloroflexia bacterium SDU3-3]
MRREGLADLVIDNFHYYYTTLAAGVTGVISEADITPVESVASQSELASYEPAGRDAIGRAAVLKLNGGLGTSMGLEKAKSLLPVRDGLSFLDIIIRQNLHARHAHGAQVPLLLMNSFSTAADTEAVLARYPEVAQQPVPLTLMQNKVPKVLCDTLAPAEAPSAPDLAWCPPGHGELYVALQTSGMLRALLDAGYEYLFISNADNLGASLDLAILGYVAAEQVPFLMEVAARTEADKKGGHLAQRADDGRLLLREVAQCPEADMAAFQDIQRHRYFNTNNIWLNLRALAQVLAEQGGVIKLPMIRNKKTLDPREPQSPAVYQLETAMGAAIEVFANARALLVDRSRFMPVKTCNDLLALRSDIFELGDSYQIRQRPQRTLGTIKIELDDAYYKRIDDFEARFPLGAPSLVDCARLTVVGDVLFEQEIAMKGAVAITNPSAEQIRLPRGTVLADASFTSEGEAPGTE